MRFTLIILGCFVSSYVFAANSIYKCVDAAGKKNYQSTHVAKDFPTQRLISKQVVQLIWMKRKSSRN